MCQKPCKQVWSILLMAGAVVLITAALVTRHPVQTFIENMIKKQVVLQPGTDTFQQWADPPVPIYDDIYLFNLTNPEEFALGAKANLDVIGPFIYRKEEIKDRVNVTGDLAYVMYFDKVTYYYEEGLTKEKNHGVNISDMIYIPNLPLITVIAQLNHANLDPKIVEVLELLIEGIEDDHNITLHATVEQVLWGMDDPIIKVLYTLGLSPFPQFSLQVNGSTDPNAMTKPTVVHSGSENISEIMQFTRFHGLESNNCWKTDAANVINGTEGNMFAPLLYKDKNRTLGIYNDQLYRSVVLEYEDSSFFNDIECYNYKIPSWALQNSTLNPTNTAYYADVYTGMLNLTKCMSNVPLYITKALFLDADVRLLENVTLSVTANSSLHDTYLCVEPNLGITIDAHKRVQINIQLEHHNKSVMKSVMPAFIPLLYVDEHASITPSLSDTLKTSLLLPISISKWAPFAVCGIGAFIGLIGVVMCSMIIVYPSIPNMTGVNIATHGADQDRTSLIMPSEDDVSEDSRHLEYSANSDAFLSIEGRNSRYYEASS